MFKDIKVYRCVVLDVFISKYVVVALDGPSLNTWW